MCDLRKRMSSIRRSSLISITLGMLTVIGATFCSLPWGCGARFAYWRSTVVVVLVRVQWHHVVVICQSGKAHAFIRVARAFLVGRHAALHTCSGGLSPALRSRFTVVRQHGRYGV